MFDQQYSPEIVDRLSGMLVFFIFWGGFLLLIKLISVPAEDSKKFFYWLGNQEARIKRRINQQHPFYLSLDAWQRKEFIWRIYYFLETTEFSIRFRGNSSKVKMTIAFVAAQISYALTIRCFDRYERVIVYEDNYYSQINHHYHKGEVHPGAGIIVFSWRGIQDGLSRSNDGLNLLVHEFAHALRLEHLMMGHSYKIFDDEAFDEMNRLCEIELERMRQSEEHFFRQYAMTNIDEFFAVASENFFERAAEFKQRMPHLYDAFHGLYNQNPLAGGGQFDNRMHV